MRFGENTCYASVKCLTVSPYKMDLVAGLIRRLKVKEAALQLSFSKKDGARYVAKLLNSCIANAVHNYSYDVERLVVDQVLVGKAFILKRFMPRGRGRSTKIEKRYSNVKVVLRQMSDDELSDKSSKKKFLKQK